MVDHLSPETAGWFEERFAGPTPVQERTWERAASGDHLLAVAPTGSGKTLAAFLVALDRLFTGEMPSGGLRVLYISPLKALGTDIRENLGDPLRSLRIRHENAGREVPDIRVGIRNGDTTPAERRRQTARPPEILVTTPESLNILLLSDSGRTALSTVRICIVDEIHAIATGRRGTLLSVALERLADLAGEYQRIGLTATVRPLERAAAFLGGSASPADGGGTDPRPRIVRIVAPPSVKDIRIDVESLPSPPDAAAPDPDAFWRDIAERIRPSLFEHRSTLAFIDSRKWSEKIARLINEGNEEPLAWAHHGSLSKDMRRLVERRLKDGELRAVVATGSLELGIDIGPLDEVLLLGTPASPSAALQRAGRAGHQPGESSRARIFPIHPPDLLAAAVLSRMAVEREIEELHIPENPLDVLAQAILSICCERGRSEDDLYALMRRSWSYRNLPRESFARVVAMLRGRYAETRLSSLKPRLYADGGVLVARPGTRMQLYAGGGAIPDLGMYGVRQQGIDGTLGSLDEKFVWESQVGMVFHLGNRRWRIISIDDRNVTVLPTDEAETTEPFWRAEGGSRDPDYARRLAGLLEAAEECLAGEGGRHGDTVDENPTSPDPDALTIMLEQVWRLPPEPAAQLSDYLRSQRRTSGASLPHGGHVVAEAAADPETRGEPGTRSLFLHTCLGGRVNRPLSLALQAAWAERSPVPLVSTVTDDVIAVVINDADVEEFVGLLSSIGDAAALIRRVLEATPFFGGRFREAAGRALLLPSSTPRRRQPLWMTRQRSRNLMEAVAAYPDFPIMTEVWRSCLQDEFAMDALEDFLTSVRDGSVRVTIVRTPAPSPFTGSAVRRRLARRMTANMRDEGDSRLVSRLESDEIRRLSRAGALRPRIPAELARRLDGRRRRIEAGYAPGSIPALKAWIAEREAFDEEDWGRTLEAASAETGRPASEMEEAVASSVRTALLGPGGARWRIAADRAGEWEAAFAPSFIGIGAERPTETREPKDAGKLARAGTSASASLADPPGAAALLAFWLGGRGPMGLSEVRNRFGIPADSPADEALQEALGALDGRVVLDRIGEGDGETELCDDEGMEILLRWRRRKSRNADAPLPSWRLAGFLAVRQGLHESIRGEDAVTAVLNRLEGYPLPAGAWETAVLPARMSPYDGRLLDGPAGREEVLWVGAGPKRIAWLSAEGGWRYPSPEPAESPPGIPDGAFPGPGDAPRDFWAIADALGSGSAEAVEMLWDRVWAGRLTSSDIGVLRRGIAAGFRAAPAVESRRRKAGGLRGWAAGRPVEGRWYAPSYAEEPDDPMASDLLMRERIRLLAGRYGILSRPLLEREIPPWRWAALSRTLALMELGDELVGGRWFENLPMPQFLAPDALPLWRNGAVPGRPWCLDAADPASPCGVVDDGFLPPRREGTWLGWDADGRPACVLKPGKKELILPGEDDGGVPAGNADSILPRMAALLTERDMAPLGRLVVRTINGSEDTRSKDRLLLGEAGFTATGTGDWIRRPRPIGMR